jgi:hypothetical protein
MPSDQEIKIAWGKMAHHEGGFKVDESSLGAENDSDEEAEQNDAQNDAQNDGENDGQNDGEPSSQPENPSPSIRKISQKLQEIQKPVPQWSPKLMWADMLFRIIDAAGLKGISTMVSHVRDDQPLTM